MISYGEAELASNDDLMDEMLAAAQTAEGTLNLEAFSKGLTFDVRLYDISHETRLSTNYDDVFLTKCGNTDVESNDDDEEGRRQSQKMELSKDLKRRYTAPAIDMVAGTYRSKTLTVLLWATFVLTYFAYSSAITTHVSPCSEEEAKFFYGKTWGEATKPLGCEVGHSVLEWLVKIFAVG